MLRQAQEVMDKGLMTPAEMEAHLVAHLSVRMRARISGLYATLEQSRGQPAEAAPCQTSAKSCLAVPLHVPSISAPLCHPTPPSTLVTTLMSWVLVTTASLVAMAWCRLWVTDRLVFPRMAVQGT